MTFLIQTRWDCCWCSSTWMSMVMHQVCKGIPYSTSNQWRDQPSHRML